MATAKWKTEPPKKKGWYLVAVREATRRRRKPIADIRWWGGKEWDGYMEDKILAWDHIPKYEGKRLDYIG